MIYFRNQIITLNLDWVDDFDFLNIKINDEKGVFSFTLTDEVIYDLNDFNIQLMIESSSKLSNVKKIFQEVFLNTIVTEIKSDVKNYLESSLENFFGNGHMNFITDKQKQSEYRLDSDDGVPVEFQYDYLMDDVIAYATEYWDHEDDLTKSTVSLISDLTENGYGRHKKNNILDADDLIDYISEWTYSDRTIKSFKENLYQELSQYGQK